MFTEVKIKECGTNASCGKPEQAIHCSHSANFPN